MPRTKRNKRSSKKTMRGEYSSPNETKLDAKSIVETAIIPPYRSIMPTRYTFRFHLLSGVAYTTAWTTTMLLDMYAIAVGGSASPVRVFNNMRIIGLKVWQPTTQPAEDSVSTASVLLEFSPSLTAGFGGAPRVPYCATTSSTSKLAHLAVKPRKRELASQWFSAQQANYTLWNLQAYAGCVLQIDFVATFVNGETPVSCAYTTSVAKGTMGVTNFGVAGCRSIGLENLVNP